MVRILTADTQIRDTRFVVKTMQEGNQEKPNGKILFVMR